MLFDINDKISITLSLVVGSVGVLLSLILFVCTGMIYACIKFIQEWASPLTVINYTLFGMASGFSIATVFTHYQAENSVKLFIGWAIIFTLLTAIMRLISLIRSAKLKPKSTPQSAIGIRHDKIKQVSMGAHGWLV